MVVIRPYLAVSNALEAIELYKKVFGAELLAHMPLEEGQEAAVNLPAGSDLSKSTMHSTIRIGDAAFHMSDNFTGEVLKKTNMSVLLEPDSDEEAQKYFKQAEANNCRITTPYAKQFWGDSFGSFVDPFGISWQVNYSPNRPE